MGDPDLCYLSAALVACTFIYALYKVDREKIRAEREKHKEIIQARKELADKLLDKKPSEVERYLNAILPLDTTPLEEYKADLAENLAEMNYPASEIEQIIQAAFPE